MAQHPETTSTNPTAKRRRGSANGSAGRRAAARKSSARKAAAYRTETGELEAIIRRLERQVAELTSGSTIRGTISGATDQVGKAMSAASSQMGDMAADMLTEVAGRLRSSANSVTGVARSGVGAVAKIGSELERRPLMSVAIALGIGFLAGMAGRKNEAA